MHPLVADLIDLYSICYPSETKRHLYNSLYVAYILLVALDFGMRNQIQLPSIRVFSLLVFLSFHLLLTVFIIYLSFYLSINLIFYVLHIYLFIYMLIYIFFIYFLLYIYLFIYLYLLVC